MSSAGERLCNLEEGSPGSGTYTRHGYIFSSLAGCLTKTSENGAVKEAASQRAFPLKLPLSSGPWAQALPGGPVFGISALWSPGFSQL